MGGVGASGGGALLLPASCPGAPQPLSPEHKGPWPPCPPLGTAPAVESPPGGRDEVRAGPRWLVRGMASCWHRPFSSPCPRRSFPAARIPALPPTCCFTQNVPQCPAPAPPCPQAVLVLGAGVGCPFPFPGQPWSPRHPQSPHADRRGDGRDGVDWSQVRAGEPCSATTSARRVSPQMPVRGDLLPWHWGVQGAGRLGDRRHLWERR